MLHQWVEISMRQDWRSFSDSLWLGRGVEIRRSALFPMLSQAPPRLAICPSQTSWRTTRHTVHIRGTQRLARTARRMNCAASLGNTSDSVLALGQEVSNSEFNRSMADDTPWNPWRNQYWTHTHSDLSSRYFWYHHVFWRAQRGEGFCLQSWQANLPTQGLK